MKFDQAWTELSRPQAGGTADGFQYPMEHGRLRHTLIVLLSVAPTQVSPSR